VKPILQDQLIVKVVKNKIIIKKRPVLFSGISDFTKFLTKNSSVELFEQNRMKTPVGLTLFITTSKNVQMEKLLCKKFSSKRLCWIKLMLFKEITEKMNIQSLKNQWVNTEDRAPNLIFTRKILTSISIQKIKNEIAVTAERGGVRIGNERNLNMRVMILDLSQKSPIKLGIITIKGIIVMLVADHHPNSKLPKSFSVKIAKLQQLKEGFLLQLLASDLTDTDHRSTRVKVSRISRR
jgi:hypothetical protein